MNDIPTGITRTMLPSSMRTLVPPKGSPLTVTDIFSAAASAVRPPALHSLTYVFLKFPFADITPKQQINGP